MQAWPPLPHALALGGLVQLAPLQHPLAQLVALQLAHVPPLHATPLGHVEHAPPPLPHATASVPGMHIEPAQQPLHTVPSHTQLPPTQCCPRPHAAPPPHVQVPPAPQPSPTPPIEQSMHAMPPVPQLAVPRGSHTLPRQQPDVHEAAVHVHAPPTHC
jgi:hypothetical protein